MIQVRMRNDAFRHLGHLGLRSARLLQNLKLYKDDPLMIGYDVELAVLSDRKHERRKKLATGPLVVYISKEKPAKRMLVELPALLLSDSHSVREVTLKCIEQFSKEDEPFITPKTCSVIEMWRNDLLSEDSDKWRSASVAISDALYDDVLVAMAGTKQSLECEPVIQDSLNFYSAKILRPSVTSLDSISLPARCPERDHENLSNVLAELISQASDLQEVCELYLAELGFLPLSRDYSLAKAIIEWVAPEDYSNVWQEVWSWAVTKPTPLAQYHACSVFVCHPELIPEGKLPELWVKILSVVNHSNKRNTDTSDQESWAIRRDLARHYTYHLEAFLPENDGASIGCFAWWLAEQVANVFPPDEEAAKFYRENWIKPALELSGHIWLAASSPVKLSLHRLVTLTVHWPWAGGLLALMGDHLNSLLPAEQNKDIQASFHEVLVTNAVANLPFLTDNTGNQTFALEGSLSETVLKWAEHQDRDKREILRHLVATSKSLGTNLGVCDALRKLLEYPLVDQIAICFALKAKAYIDPTISEEVWDIVSDNVWRKDVLGGLETKVQGLLIESLSILLINNREKWFAHLPHYIADLCENSEDEEQRRLLFLFVIQTSLASETVSAVRRLLRGEQKAKFVGLAKEYRSQIQALRANYPPWVSGKMRSLMASFHIV